jgi:hypothetical protein
MKPSHKNPAPVAVAVAVVVLVAVVAVAIAAVAAASNEAPITQKLQKGRFNRSAPFRYSPFTLSQYIVLHGRFLEANDSQPVAPPPVATST